MIQKESKLNNSNMLLYKIKPHIESFFRERDLSVKSFSKNCIYSFYSVFFIIIAINHDQFLSPSSYSVDIDFNNTIFDWYKRALYHPAIKEFSLQIIIINIICLLILIFSRRNFFILKLLTTYLLLNINNKLVAISDGGFNITTLLCILLCLVNTSGTEHPHKNTFYNDLLTAISNTFFFLCKIQLSTMYLMSGIYKLQGVLWQKGVAIYYVLQNEEYSHPVWKALIENNDFLITFLTYSTIGLQIAYPFLIWNKNTRLLILTAICFFHLGTIFIMGLTTFGLCGIISNTIFLKENDIYFITKFKNQFISLMSKWLKQIKNIVKKFLLPLIYSKSFYQKKN